MQGTRRRHSPLRIPGASIFLEGRGRRVGRFPPRARTSAVGILKAARMSHKSGRQFPKSLPFPRLSSPPPPPLPSRKKAEHAAPPPPLPMRQAGGAGGDDAKGRALPTKKVLLPDEDGGNLAQGPKMRVAPGRQEATKSVPRAGRDRARRELQREPQQPQRSGTNAPSSRCSGGGSSNSSESRASRSESHSSRSRHLQSGRNCSSLSPGAPASPQQPRQPVEPQPAQRRELVWG